MTVVRRAFPTTRALRTHLGIDAPTARLARTVGKACGAAALTGMLEVWPERFPKSKRWLAECYNVPTTPELRMAMLDDLCDTHGVEAIMHPRQGYTSEPFATYLNTGDGYDATIVRYATGSYRITSWAAVVESNRF